MTDIDSVSPAAQVFSIAELRAKILAFNTSRFRIDFFAWKLFIMPSPDRQIFVPRPVMIEFDPRPVRPRLCAPILNTLNFPIVEITAPVRQNQFKRIVNLLRREHHLFMAHMAHIVNEFVMFATRGLRRRQLHHKQNC